MNVVKALYWALRAYVVSVEWKRAKYLDELEDERDSLAADGSPYAKLRLEVIGERIKRERQRVIRPADSDAD